MRTIHLDMIFKGVTFRLDWFHMFPSEMTKSSWVPTIAYFSCIVAIVFEVSIKLFTIWFRLRVFYFLCNLLSRLGSLNLHGLCLISSRFFSEKHERAGKLHDPHGPVSRFWKTLPHPDTLLPSAQRAILLCTVYNGR